MKDMRIGRHEDSILFKKLLPFMFFMFLLSKNLPEKFRNSVIPSKILPQNH